MTAGPYPTGHSLVVSEISRGKYDITLDGVTSTTPIQIDYVYNFLLEIKSKGNAKLITNNILKIVCPLLCAQYITPPSPIDLTLTVDGTLPKIYDVILGEFVDLTKPSSCCILTHIIEILTSSPSGYSTPTDLSLNVNTISIMDVLKPQTITFRITTTTPFETLSFLTNTITINCGPLSTTIVEDSD